MRLPLLAAVVLSVSGCSSVITDMQNNNFPAVVAVPVPPKMVGIWTGSIGYYLTTTRFEKDGTGVMCASWNGRDSLNRVKYDGKEVRFADGGRTEIKSLGSLVLVLRANYYFGADYTLHRDDEMKQAAPYCVEKLKAMDKNQG
jgi:hypothetical protein